MDERSHPEQVASNAGFGEAAELGAVAALDAVAALGAVANLDAVAAPGDALLSADRYGEIVALIGSLAHEIKNPLSTIGLNLELLAEDFDQAETPRDRRACAKISVVQRECQRLQKLLDDFLSFARLERLTLELADLNSEVSRVLDFMRPQTDAAAIDVIRYLDPDLPTVMLDPQAFQAALLNLVLNAQQAMRDGGQLVVRTRSAAGRVALDLIDTGCGMDEKTLAHAFEVFFSTKQGGTGLGLPTTRKIVEAHGGRLLVQSEPGRGTQFTVELTALPQIAPSPAPVAAVQLPARPSDGSQRP